MATVNFSVPDEVKAEFDKAFGDQNKSSIIAELMRRAVREHRLQIRRERLFRQLSSARRKRPSFTSEELRRARSGRTIVIVVLDASVILKWLFEDPAREPDTEKALAVIESVVTGQTGDPAAGPLVGRSGGGGFSPHPPDGSQRY